MMVISTPCEDNLNVVLSNLIFFFLRGFNFLIHYDFVVLMVISTPYEDNLKVIFVNFIIFYEYIIY